ncbi:MAG: papain-like cysteine protease family protein [Negativicutes bacterium]|nr:papain-like cysteine protease family protein [Negativicutes bacterium]
MKMIKLSQACRLLAAILLACQIWLLPQVMYAETAHLGPGLYMAGVPTEQFQYFAAPDGYGRQRAANWCWAASIQMVLNYHGLYITQEEIVTRIYGKLIDQPGEPAQILQALSGWAPDMRGRYSAIVADPYSISEAALVSDLAYRWPLIVGLKGDPVGHAYVLTAVNYEVDSQNNPNIKSVVLRNPWPGGPSREVMNWKEFMSRLTFATRVRVLRN